MKKKILGTLDSLAVLEDALPPLKILCGSSNMELKRGAALAFAELSEKCIFF